MSHFNTPSSDIKFKSPHGINAHIRRDKGVPGAFPLPVEEELYIHAGISCLDGGVGVANGSVPLCSLGLLKPLMMSGAQRLPKALSYLVLPILIIPMTWHLKCLLWMNWSNSAHGNPAVNQQVVKAETLNDGSPEHLDGVGNFGLKHLLLTGVDSLVLAALLAVLGILLLLCKPLDLLASLPLSVCIVASTIN